MISASLKTTALDNITKSTTFLLVMILDGFLLTFYNSDSHAVTHILNGQHINPSHKGHFWVFGFSVYLVYVAFRA